MFSIYFCVYKYFLKIIFLFIALYFQSKDIFVQLFFKTTPQKQLKIIKICAKKTPYFQNKFSNNVFYQKITKHVFKSKK